MAFDEAYEERGGRISAGIGGRVPRAAALVAPALSATSVSQLTGSRRSSTTPPRFKRTGTAAVRTTQTPSAAAVRSSVTIEREESPREAQRKWLGVDNLKRGYDDRPSSTSLFALHPLYLSHCNIHSDSARAVMID